MKKPIGVLLLMGVIYAQAQSSLRLELFSPKCNLRLILRDGRFQILRLAFSGDIISASPGGQGSFTLSGDTVRLITDAGKTLKLVRETDEIFRPVAADTIPPAALFLAWTSFYDNGHEKQNGGWTTDGQKDGVWRYFDSITALVINQRLYRRGELVTDHFKFAGDR